MGEGGAVDWCGGWGGVLIHKLVNQSEKEKK